MRAFDFASKQLWAIFSQIDAEGNIESPHLRTILEIAQRAHEPNFEVVSQRMAQAASNDGLVEMRSGGIAVVNVIGPIFRYANLFTMISGATSVEGLATTFRAAVEDPNVAGIVLNIDSPGGEVSGISELASAIFEARSSKPIVAYADDLTASGAYWLASAASKIVASDTAELGSIGVVATVVEREPAKGVKSYQFVSSVSPRKRPDLTTDDGRNAIQQRIDDLANVFVAAVARNRDVTVNHVLASFGQGGVLIASKAIAAGMADESGSFESVVGELQDAKPNRVILLPGVVGGNTARGGQMAEKPKAAEGIAAMMVECPKCGNEFDSSGNEASLAEITKKAASAGRTEGVTEGIVTERKRIAAILSSTEAAGRESLARSIALESDLTPEAAQKLLASAALTVAPPAKINPLTAAMAAVPNPNVGGGGEASEEAAMIAGVLAFANKPNGGSK